MYQFESPALGNLVRSAWSVAYDGHDDAMPGIIAPDAHIELVFQTGSPCALDFGGKAFASSPNAMLFALRRGVLRLRPTGANRPRATGVHCATRSAPHIDC